MKVMGEVKSSDSGRRCVVRLLAPGAALAVRQNVGAIGRGHFEQAASQVCHAPLQLSMFLLLVGVHSRNKMWHRSLQAWTCHCPWAWAWPWAWAATRPAPAMPT